MKTDNFILIISASIPVILAVIGFFKDLKKDKAAAKTTNIAGEKTQQEIYQGLLNDLKSELNGRIDRIRQDHKEEIERMNDIIKKKDDEITALKSENESLDQRITDLEEENKRIKAVPTVANVLEVMHTKVDEGGIELENKL